MKAKIISALLAMLCIVTLAACGKAEEKLEEQPASEQEQNEESLLDAADPSLEKSSLVPENTEGWTSQEWDQWIEEGYDTEEWDASAFDAAENTEDTDVWDEDVWGDDNWTEQPLSTVSAPVLDELPLENLVSTNKSLAGSGLLTNMSATQNDSNARAIFAAFNPGAEILTVHPQNNGRTFAIYGLKDNTKYKMVVDAATNEVYLNKAISIGQENESSEESQSPSETSTPVTEEDAAAIFSSHHPDASLLKSQLQDDGNHFYLYGLDGTHRYQMKIRVADGTVLLNRSNQINGHGVQNPTGYYPPGEELDLQDTAEDDADASDSSAVEPTPITGPISEEDATNIFLSHYPNATLLKTELQDGGSSYYLYGQEGNSRYKMKILTANGQIVMNRSNHSGQGQTNQEVPPATTSGDVPVTSGSIDESGARAIFNSYYPDVPIQKVELQDGGTKYYLYGESGGVHYKMNVLTDGTVVYNYPSAGTTGSTDYSNNNTGDIDSSSGATDSYSGATNSGGSDSYSGATGQNSNQNRGRRY